MRRRWRRIVVIVKIIVIAAAAVVVVALVRMKTVPTSAVAAALYIPCLGFSLPINNYF